MDTHKFKTFYKLSESESNVLKEKYCILFDKNIEDKNKNITEEQYDVLQPFQLQSNDIVKNILIPSLLTVLLIFGILLATGVISLGSLFSGKVEVPDGIVIVPDVEGMEKDEAIRTIEGMNLLVSAEGNVVSDYIQAGKIVLQSPNGGSYIEKYGIYIRR